MSRPLVASIRALSAALLLVVAACGGDKLPEKYAALGIPADPDRVEKVEKFGSHYTITYRSAWSGDGMGAMLDAIKAAGYERKDVGDWMEFAGPGGTFTLSCQIKAAPPACMLTPDAP